MEVPVQYQNRAISTIGELFNIGEGMINEDKIMYNSIMNYEGYEYVRLLKFNIRVLNLINRYGENKISVKDEIEKVSQKLKCYFLYVDYDNLIYIDNVFELSHYISFVYLFAIEDSWDVSYIPDWTFLVSDNLDNFAKNYLSVYELEPDEVILDLQNKNLDLIIDYVYRRI